MKIAVIVASLGRPTEIAELLLALDGQTRPADTILLSVTGPADLPPDLPPASKIQVVQGPKGLPAQRNTGLDALAGPHDLIAFFDDDYLPSRTALAGIEALFAAHPEVVGANGRLLADGIRSKGISHAEALAMLDRHEARPPGKDLILREMGHGLYGCNMVFRASALRGARFDERLPLYGWQEDLDFSSPLTAKGRLVQGTHFVGVHRGVKGGRTSGLKFGYSQVANPIYLAGKGTMRWPYALQLMLRNLAANLLRTVAPEPWVDRAGRVRGNWMALADMLHGRMKPERITDLA